MFNDVIGRGRQHAEIDSAVTGRRRTMRRMYMMLGTSFAFGHPTLTEISLKLSKACDKRDSCAACLMMSMVAVVAERKRI